MKLAGNTEGNSVEKVGRKLTSIPNDLAEKDKKRMGIELDFDEKTRTHQTYRTEVGAGSTAPAREKDGEGLSQPKGLGVRRRSMLTQITCTVDRIHRRGGCAS